LFVQQVISDDLARGRVVNIDILLVAEGYLSRLLYITQFHSSQEFAVGIELLDHLCCRIQGIDVGVVCHGEIREVQEICGLVPHPANSVDLPAISPEQDFLGVVVHGKDCLGARMVGGFEYIFVETDGVE
jgi:hypothetical protein